MSNWSFEILRQGSWDLWSWVCLAACIVLLSYAVAGRVWATAHGLLRSALIAGGVAGTILILATPPLRTPAVGLVWTFILLCLVSAVFYLNLHPQLGNRRMSILLALRIAALALLVPMLFEPVLRFVARPEPTRPLLMLIDTSGSMSFPDIQNGPTRLQSVWQTLRPQLPKISEHFVPHFFTFDSSLTPVDDPESLASRQADGQSTDIAGALAQALATTPRTDAAVILISDGIDNTSPDVEGAVRASLRPIHTVRVGSEQTEPATLANIAVDNIEAGDDFVVGHDSTIKATIKSSALANRVVEVKLAKIDAQGKTIGEIKSTPLVLQPLAQGQVVELTYRPDEVGIQRLAVWVDPVPGERSTVDNRQEYQGLALDPRIRVLYIEGRARPEYRDLNRALGRDPNVEVATLLRITQDRFTASGTVNGEPFKRMPQTAADWQQFDVILLGDLDASFLTPQQQTAIEQAVSRGAGLLMIGGQNSFGPGNYRGTPIEQALPVLVGGLDAAQEKTEFVPQLTDEGQLHPAMEGLGEWFSGGSGGQPGSADDPGRDQGPRAGADPASGSNAQLPPLRGNVVVERPKTGAQVLLVHPGRPGPDGQPQIILATQPYGQGRSAAFTADTTYLWYLPLRGMGQDSPYNRFWGQLVRWLAGADVKNRQRGSGVEALLNKNLYQLGESVRVRAMVRDERGDATRYAQVTATLRRPPGAPERDDPQQLPMTPSDARTGMYDLTVPHPQTGDWELEISATKDGRELGGQTLRFTVIPPADEMLKIAANPALLEAIATGTNGFHYTLPQLPTLIDQLIRQDASALQSEQRSIPLHNLIRLVAAATGHFPDWPRRYDLPIQAAFVTGLLAGEWILRRRWQLP